MFRISREIGQRLNETDLAMHVVCVEGSTMAGMLRLEIEEERVQVKRELSRMVGGAGW